MAVQKQKVVSRIEPAGWLLVILGGVLPLILGCVLNDGVLLVFAGVVLLVMVLARVLGRWNLTQLAVEVEMPSRIHAGKGFEMTARLENRKSWLDSFQVSVVLKLLHGARLEGLAKWLSAGDQSCLQKRVSIPLRGKMSELTLEISSRFPLGLFRHVVDGKHPVSLTVYPRLITPLELRNSGSLTGLDRQEGIQRGDHEGELRGIRAWQPGDPSRRIHWAASARAMASGQGLKVRELDPPGQAAQSCAVIFHSQARRGLVYRQDRFERACSLAAGVMHVLHRRGMEVVFTADFLGWEERECHSRLQYTQTLELLAVAERSPEREQEKVEAVIEKWASHQLIILISDVEPDEWPEALALSDHVLVIDIRQIRYQRGALKKVS